MDRVTLQDVADHARVSMKTVSNVVRGYAHVRPEMRARVQSSIDALGYRPNRSGQVLVTGRSRMLALAVPDLRRPYFAELAHEFGLASIERGYRVLLEETDATEAGERSAVHDHRSGIVDGVALYPAILQADTIDELARSTPVVTFGENIRAPRVDQIVIDNVTAAREATAHLIALGRRRLGFVGYELGELTRTSALRMQGFREAMDAAGIPVDERNVIGRTVSDAPHGEESVGAALDDGLDVDGILCRDDLAAVGALRALQTRGLSVPRDVAIVGWDANELGATTFPSLTTVAPDLRSLVHAALDALIARIEGSEEPGREIIVGHRLLVRESAPSLDASS